MPQNIINTKITVHHHPSSNKLHSWLVFLFRNVMFIPIGNLLQSTFLKRFPSSLTPNFYPFPFSVLHSKNKQHN